MEQALFPIPCSFLQVLSYPEKSDIVCFSCERFVNVGTFQLRVLTRADKAGPPRNAAGLLVYLFVLPDAVGGEPGDEVLKGQLVRQKLAVGGGFGPSLRPEGLHFGGNAVPLRQKLPVQAVIGRQTLGVRHQTLNRK